MSTVLEVVYRDGRIELPPGARIAENTRALLILLDDSEQPREGTPLVVKAAGRTEAWQRLRGIAATDGPPPTDEEVREMYTDYLSEKYQ
jgi:hypothetical protein